MHKRHAANKIPNTTACGYECTGQEYEKMLVRKADLVTCYHCLKVAKK